MRKNSTLQNIKKFFKNEKIMRKATTYFKILTLKTVE